ncbi:MiaB/RimO family radical SAM methylthiotransferase [Patescibacteria group bacterium]|nr:MiaB/RimO family radical SAM methylthiotransferase [Patescibacteria group bacterium]MBU0964097.1 MiaB/RimO family radical SAM methylthiotransferase [Patescibacteria group bacterium]
MKYFLFVIGCQMNESDAERVANILEMNGCSRTTDEQSADLIIIVSCSVRQKAMDRIYGRLNKWRRWKKQRDFKTILTGCVLPADKKKLKRDFDIIIAINDIEKLPQQLGLKKQTSHDNITNADYLALKALHNSAFQAFVPIMTGCNNYCTYCAVPYTRGQEASRPSSEIITEIKQLITKDYKEITLLGQNVNAYIDPEKKHNSVLLKTRSRNFWQFEKNQPIQFRSATTKVPKDFAELLKKINKIPGEFWIRFLTSNPQDVSEELLKTLPQLNKVTKYFHLPIQAGDDEILRRMNRRHTKKYYLELIQKIRQAWPGIAISTDVIVGFPGETKKQFEQTAKFMEQVKYDMAYLARYSPRPGTAAERFFKDDIPKEEKARREVILNEILKKTALANNKKLIGKTVKVLVENYNKSKKENLSKTETFKNVRFKGDNLTGQFINIKITKATAWGLQGVIKKDR